MMIKFHAWLTSEAGLTGVEYSLIAGVVAGLGALTAVTVGDQFMALFDASLLDHIPVSSLNE